MSGFGKEWRDWTPPRTTGGTLPPPQEPPPAPKKEGRVKGAKRCVLTEDDAIFDVADAKARGIDGITFMSRREAKHFIPLRRREKAGEIRNLKRQVRIPLFAVRPDGLKEKVCVYVADYVWEERVQVLVEGGYASTSWRTVIADAKGWRTDIYKIKAKWVAIQTGAAIVEL